MDSFFQFATVLLIFIFVLAITYLTTRWVGNIQKVSMKGRNVEILEGERLTQSQFIQIVRIGEKYYALGISKDQITKIAELSKDELIIPEEDGPGQASGDTFQRVLEQAKKMMPHR